jgi:predicted GIY-YIG superfamily endonuclease
MVTSGKVNDRIADNNWFVYVLALQNDNYYVGLALL